jgi:hypothetical protein
MKAAAALLLLPALTKAAYYSREQYDSGEVHQMILDMKNVSSPIFYCSSLPLGPPC